MELEPGTVQDRYEVVDHLGRGGMATVYKVRHTSLGTLHALKLLTVTGADVRDRLMQEGRVQAALRHPNVLSVTDVILVEDAPGLIMEMVHGPSLDELMARAGLTVEQIDVLARGILAGVAHAHARGLVHRDLKPSNILCAVGDQGNLVPKVADFGLVKASGADTSGPRKTQTGQILGTPYYMAPEQIRDSKRVDHRADVWAVGVMLFEMLTGAPPFDGKDVFQVFAAITKGAWAWPEDLPVEVPERMRRAVDAALRMDLEERAASCDEILRLWQGEGEAYVPLPEVTWDEAVLAPYRAAVGSPLSDPVPPARVAAPAHDDLALLGTDGLPDFDDSLGDLSPPPPSDQTPPLGPTLAPVPTPGRRSRAVPWSLTAGLVVLLLIAVAIWAGSAHFTP